MKYKTPKSETVGTASTLIQSKPFQGSDNGVQMQPKPVLSNLLEG